MIRSEIICLAVVVLAAAPVHAADFTDVSFTNCTGGVLKFDANGTYQVEDGYTVTSFTLSAQMGDQTTTASVTYANGNWNKTLNLAPGTYDVTVTISTRMGTTTVSVSRTKTGIVVTAN